MHRCINKCSICINQVWEPGREVCVCVWDNDLCVLYLFEVYAHVLSAHLHASALVDMSADGWLVHMCFSAGLLEYASAFVTGSRAGADVRTEAVCFTNSWWGMRIKSRVERSVCKSVRKTFHLPVLHCSGIIRQRHTALERDRDRKKQF